MGDSASRLEDVGIFRKC